MNHTVHVLQHTVCVFSAGFDCGNWTLFWCQTHLRSFSFCGRGYVNVLIHLTRSRVTWKMVTRPKNGLLSFKTIVKDSDLCVCV